ncbi:MAG: tetratricopeptide repeat protein, partial [Candidatus Marsarchaeota archaeon]|nr:tetratricopeptide repeat protein [Candidatus Marsarchaeota archaeon]
MGRTDLAIDYLSHTIEANKDNPMAKASLQLALVHQYLGSLYLDQGRTDDAIAEFRQSLEIDRGNAETLRMLGKGLATQGQIDEA